MKILYITSRGKQAVDYRHDNKVYDLKSTTTSISEGILSHFNDVELTLISDLVPNDNISIDTLKSFDLILCDPTSGNSNVLYQVGRAESLGIPIIYFMSNEYTAPLTMAHKRILLYSDASIDIEFLEKLNSLIDLAKTDPSLLLDESPAEEKQPKAFISYNHKNRAYLDRLLVHLKPLTKKGIIDIWVDTKIKTGDKWREEIEKALDNASIAILLISADFMASDFIVDNELPPLLSKAEVDGTRILPVILSPCRFTREPSLNRFQAANSPTQPLSSMTEDERETIYDQLAHDIEHTMKDS